MKKAKHLFFFFCILGKISAIFAQNDSCFYYLLNPQKAETKAFIAKNKIAIQKEYSEIPLSTFKAKKDFNTGKIEDIWIYRADNQAKTEMSVPGHNLSVNYFNWVHQNYPYLNGAGKKVSLKENTFDTTDIDFLGRVLNNETAATEISTHATLMASIIAGGGNSAAGAKGGAWGAKIASSNFANLLADADSSLLKNDISVQNHSYGTEIASNYGAEAYSYDAQSKRLPHLLHVFSAGNEGLNSANSGEYANIQGYANLTGNVKMAKNVLTVGAVNSEYQIQPYSSRGPAIFGRVKPEIVAYSENGTSDAAASVSAAALLLQQHYETLFHQKMPASLQKATLLNSAQDVGAKGLDYSSGYGSLNIAAALQNTFLLDTLFSKMPKQYPLNVPISTAKLKLTLAWTDEETPDGKLSEDLDIRLRDKNDNIFLPWCLDVRRDSILKPAFRGRDSLNPQEQISIDFPTVGNDAYTIEIQANNLKSAFQPFAIAIQLSAVEPINWTFPAQEEAAFQNEKVTLRWFGENSAKKGILSYQWQGDSAWAFIDSVAATAHHYKWNLPDSTGILRFLFKNNEGMQASPFLHIHPPLHMNVGFDCADSVAFFWNKLTQISDYQLFSLGSQYLEPNIISADTLLVLTKNNLLPYRWSVAPIFSDGQIGIKSSTPDYRTQGLDCYFKSFLAENNTAGNIRVAADIGTTYQLEKIEFEKWEGTHFQAIGQAFSPQNLHYELIDNQPNQGLNRYRAKLSTKGLGNIYSQEAIIRNAGAQPFVLYPNPLPNTRDNFQVFCKNYPEENLFLSISDLSGREIFSSAISDTEQSFSIEKWASGIYIYQFYTPEKLLMRGLLMRN